MTQILIIIGAVIVAFIFARSFFMLLFSMQNYGTHKERLRQLQQADMELVDEENSTARFVSIITKPITTYLLPKLKPKDTEQLERDLKITGWDLYMDPAQYRALNILLKVIGVIALFAIYPISPLFAVVFFALFFFLFGFLFKNSITERNKALFNQFPDFIRIIQGYLMAGVPLTKAVEETIPYVGDDWKPILKNFLLNCNVYSVTEAIDILIDEVDVFEVREFFSLVRLNLEQGINIKESFESQTKKVEEMQLEVMLNKIGRRQMMSKIVQAPLLLCMFVAAGLPTFYSMMTFSTM